SIDYSTFDDCQFICSGSSDKTVRVWDVDNNKQIQLFNGHSSIVYCVKFSPYHYHNHHQNVILSSSHDNNIRSWDFKHNKPLKYSMDTHDIYCIRLSSFNCGRYLCSGSFDTTIRLWDVETSKQLHIFSEHRGCIWSIDISPLQSNYNNDNNNIGVIGGNGYTICSGSGDNTIRILDIETFKQSNVFKGHKDHVWSVKYGSNELLNTILSGSYDKKRILSVEYSPFVIKDYIGNSNVISSLSFDNKIYFWYIRFIKKELYAIKEYKISCLKFIKLKKKENDMYLINLCYGSNGPIHICG
ncbi:hypothetical protein RFI_30035, partial [Reticulomyxa filosa]